jgi:hypothetical protein
MLDVYLQRKNTPMKEAISIVNRVAMLLQMLEIGNMLCTVKELY